MSVATIIVTLDRAARKSGGDRYIGVFSEKDFLTYIPQEISRPEGVPLKKIKITYEAS